MPDYLAEPWTVPTCPTGPLHNLPYFNRYQNSYESHSIPIYLALYDTTTCIRLNYANSYCFQLHRTYQEIALRFLHRIETTNDLQQQLAWYHPHTQGYWQTLLSLNRSFHKSILMDYGVNHDYVYLLFAQNVSFTMPWFQMTPYHLIFFGFGCPPFQASVRLAELAPTTPNTLSPSVNDQRSNKTADEANLDDEEESTDVSEGGIGGSAAA